MQFAQATDGTQLAYVIDDFTDPWRDAPYILLQHGFGRNARFWYKWVPYLARHFRVIRPDMRGFGQSRQGFSLERGFDLPTQAQDLSVILDDIGIDSVHYVGEAFGGTLGIQFAANFPGRVRTLNLLSGPVYLHQKVQDIFAMGEKSWADALRIHGVRKWAEATNTVSRFPTWMGEGFLGWYTDELAMDDAETLAQFSLLCEAYDQRQLLPSITAPVLGIYPRSRGEQVDLLKQGVKDLSIIHMDTEYYLIYQIFAASCARNVASFAAQHEGMNIHEF